MTQVYRIEKVTESGMYSYGEWSASPEIAKRATGYMTPYTGMYQVVAVPFPGEESGAASRVVVEMETMPAEWGIRMAGR